MIRVSHSLFSGMNYTCQFGSYNYPDAVAWVPEGEIPGNSLLMIFRFIYTVYLHSLSAIMIEKKPDGFLLSTIISRMTTAR